ncbi:alpha/beta hydrolase [Rhizomonospora bruguierae]|uniref:alpha/beta hydrolase n=1 Tax=Rhizomonospora bruguierae TaxID=1581705 RepID=UPI001BD0EB7B|nr:alpha/beta fold hydrolase [Micromonospora sp. NBRC 107566]
MRRLLPAAVLAVLAVLAAGCDSSAPAAGATAAPTPAPQARCLKTTPSTPTEVTTEDGVKLSAARFGDGARGVVLLHQSNGDLCGWYDFAADLAGTGYHVLAVDFRCFGFSGCADRGEFVTDAKAAVAALRAAGATRVTLMGSSIGAATALVVGAREPDSVNAVVALSPHQMYFRATTGDGIATPSAAKDALRVPLLLVVGRSDPSCISEADGQAIVAVAPTEGKRLIALSTATHGWDLIQAGVGDDVKTFLAANG